MEVRFLEHDGRCKWLENKVLKGIYVDAMKQMRDPRAKRPYVIVDWISNDDGRVGVDLKWLKTLGVPAVESYEDLPEGKDFLVVNTGYDSIVEEERLLRRKGVEIRDEPCPFIRRLRKLLEQADPGYQYVLLCEANHIVIRNFASLFPADMILVQMKNYRERILAQANGKPFLLLPYVTFLPVHSAEIMAFLEAAFPALQHRLIETYCMWIKSKASPILEIERLDDSALSALDTALLVTGAASANKSLASLLETLERRGLPVVTIATLKAYREYERSHPDAVVLLVRSPIPNSTESEIMAYLKHGYLGALLSRITANRWLKAVSIGAVNRIVYGSRWLWLGSGEIARRSMAAASRDER